MGGLGGRVQGYQPELLSIWWRVAYWYGFTVQFTLLPFHQEYADCGAFTVADRITTSLRNNLIFYAILLVLSHPLHLRQQCRIATAEETAVALQRRQNRRGPALSRGSQGAGESGRGLCFGGCERKPYVARKGLTSKSICGNMFLSNLGRVFDQQVLLD